MDGEARQSADGQLSMHRFICHCCQTAFLIRQDLEEWHCPETGQLIRFPQPFPVDNRLSEAEWAAWSEPEQILPYLHRKASKRKLRLLYCAFCRRLWDHLTVEHRRAVDIAEHFAVGLASQVELMEAFRQSGFQQTRRYGTPWPEEPQERQMMQYVRHALRPEDHSFAYSVRLDSSERKFQCETIRDSFGQLHWDARIEPSWLMWNQGVVSKLGQVICKEGRFENLPILADALEEAGCTNAAILNHCRQSSEHVRGCWVVDLILGKK